MNHRVGIGYDSHVFDPTRPLLLGGVEIPGAPGLMGHSDGDAVAHALIDALLGAAGMGDVGRWFPDDDEQYRNADSMALLATVVARLSDAGMRINNVDATIIAERPKLSPHITGMCERLSGVLGIPMEAVSVKAKTNEGMDAVGEGKGLQVMAVASVQER